MVDAAALDLSNARGLFKRLDSIALQRGRM
jgi:hypothetical protein